METRDLRDQCTWRDYVVNKNSFTGHLRNCSLCLRTSIKSLYSTVHKYNTLWNVYSVYVFNFVYLHRSYPCLACLQMPTLNDVEMSYYHVFFTSTENVSMYAKSVVISRFTWLAWRVKFFRRQCDIAGAEIRARLFEFIQHHLHAPMFASRPVDLASSIIDIIFVSNPK